ncbi:phage tail protein [Pseudomonas veronii]|uniref:phage tail protein n=1 Tax=Pseudomonas veronii TaxID=76761 RepID=UPI00163CA96B|nr:phage tail protein [Pseudomonas veronii]
MTDQNSQFFAILTAVGEAKQANAAALGTSWTFAQMAVGDANGTDPIPSRTQTKLINERRRAPLNQVKVDPANASVIIAEQIIPESVGGFWVRELALYDADGDMVAVANCAPTYKPLLSQGSGRTQVIRINLIVSSTANIELKIDPSVVLATRSYVDSSILNVLPAGRPAGTYTKVQINARGVVIAGSNPTTLDGYGITNAVVSDQITDAGLVNGEMKRPYFRHATTGDLVLLSVVGHEHDFRDLVNLPPSVAGHGINDVYTKEQVETELKKRVGRDAVITLGLINGDPTRPYLQQEGTLQILPLARGDLVDTQLSNKVDSDWITAAGLVGNNPKYPYMRQKGTSTLVSLVAVSELSRNTCVMGLPGWWMCGDTGLLRQKLSVLVGDFGPTFTGTVAWPIAFPRSCDSVKISLRNGGSLSPVGSCVSYSDASKTGCNWRIEEWASLAQSGQLTLIIEAEGY